MKTPTYNKIELEMFEAAARERGTKNRKYLGMSEIGKPCARALWYNFRGFAPREISGRALMLFRFGDRIEEEVIYHLRLAGYHVEGQQEGFQDHDGLFRGHCDGIIYGVTQRPHILEIKSANDKKFKLFREHGVRKTYTVYWCQCQCYMGYSGLDRALVVVQNKNNSDLYTERIYPDQEAFQSLRQRAFDIITAKDPPDKPFGIDSFDCTWCDHRLNCWYPDESPVTRHVCGTCRFLDWVKLDRFCEHHLCQLYQWGVGCQDWEELENGL